MFESNVPEKLIQARTGHRCVESLRLYERPSEQQQQAVLNILTTSSREFGTEITNISAANEITQPSNSMHMASTQKATQRKQCPSVPAFSTMFGNMTNCTITISPQNFVVNVNPASSETTVEEECDSVVKNCMSCP